MRKIFWSLVAVGVLLRVVVAWEFQSRSWTDEMGAVLNPAYLTAFDYGRVGEDFAVRARSWVAPSWVATQLRVMDTIGVRNGSVVLPLMRVLLTLWTTAATVFFALVLAKRFGLKNPPWVFIVLGFISPELIRYAGFADLAAIATPFLLAGLGLWFLYLDRPRKKGTTLTLGFWGAGLLSLAAVMRYQFAIVCFILVVERVVRKKRDYFSAVLLVIAGAVALAYDLAYNSYRYGDLVLPLWHYFKYNITQGNLAATGESSIFHGVELFWRFATEPVALLAIALAPYAWKKDRLSTAVCFASLVFHCLVGHKEYRYFYTAALMLTLLAGIGLQSWASEVGQKKRRRPALIGALVLFLAFAGWRAGAKTQWREFEVPSKLETWVGEQQDLKGLLVYGWQGIFHGGQYSMCRSVPYEFVERPLEFSARKLKAKDYNYVIAEKSWPPPCQTFLRTDERGRVYRCTEAEIGLLLNSKAWR